MTYDPFIHRRRSIRLSGFDYATPGAYFVTICIQGGLCLLGDLVEGEMQLSLAGEMVTDVWSSLERELAFVRIGDFVVMPNHLHGVIWLVGLGSEGAHGVRPYDDDEGDCPAGLGEQSREGEPRVRPLCPRNDLDSPGREINLPR